MAGRRLRPGVSRSVGGLCAAMLIAIVANPAPGSPPHPTLRPQTACAPTGVATVGIDRNGPGRVAPAPAWHVVATSRLAPGVRFVRIRQTSPPQRTEVIRVSPRAQLRIALVRAGSKAAPFATVSSAVERTDALAGVNGYFRTSPPHSPMLVRDGRSVASARGAVARERHPRTGFGVTADGTALLVTVDGRRRTAVGMTRRELAAFMRSLGAVWAVNLDGGASTTMVVRGRVSNLPSDPLGERLIPTAVVLLPSGHDLTLRLPRQLHDLDGRIVLPIRPSPLIPKDADGIPARV